MIQTLDIIPRIFFWNLMTSDIENLVQIENEAMPKITLFEFPLFEDPLYFIADLTCILSM